MSEAILLNLSGLGSDSAKWLRRFETFCCRSERTTPLKQFGHSAIANPTPANQYVLFAATASFVQLKIAS